MNNFAKEENRIAVHEAGHYLMAKHYGLSCNEQDDSCRVIIPKIIKKEDYEHLIQICYAGLLAEVEIYGTASGGFIHDDGSGETDFQKARQYIYEYEILFNHSLSLNGTDEDLDKRMTQVSMDMERLASIIIRRYREKLMTIACN